MSAFVFRSFSKSVRGAENWTGEWLADQLVWLRLRLSHMTFNTKYFRPFMVRPVFSGKRTWTSPIIPVLTDVLTARTWYQTWRRLCLLQPFQVLHDEGGDRGPHKLNCPSIINARQLVRTKSFEHREEEREVLCESLNSSASNSQYSLTGLTCSSPASPPVANPAAPRQPGWRVRAASHLRPCFYPGFCPRHPLPLRDLDAPVGSFIQTSVPPLIGSRTLKVPAGASWCFYPALLLLFLLEFETDC